MGNPMNPTNEEIRLDLCEAIETLNSLIDGESDELGQLLTPIVSLLERIVTHYDPSESHIT